MRYRRRRSTGDQSAPPVSTSARVARNTGVRLLAELLSKLALLALFAVLARHLGTERFGDFAFAVSLAMLITALGGVGTDEIVARHVGRRPDRIDEVVWNALAVKLGVGGLAVLTATAVGLLGEHSLDVRVTLALIAASASTDLLSATLYSVFQGLDDLAPEAIARTVQTWLRAAFGIGALLAGGGVVLLAAVYLFTSLLGLSIAAYLLAARVGTISFRVEAATARALTLTGLPIALGALFETLALSADTLILSAMDGKDAVGLFGSTTRLVEGSFVVASAFVAAVVPVLIRAARDDAAALRNVYEVACKFLIGALLPISATFILFPEPLLRLFFGPGFVPAATALRLVGATAVLHGLSQLSFSTLIATGHQRVIPWIATAAAVENLALTLLLVPDHSINGAALAMFLSALTYAVLAVGATVRHTGSLSLPRVASSPTVGLGVMVLVALTLPRSAPAAVVAAGAYALTVWLVERQWHPSDLAWVGSVLRRSAR